jgi:hypothetical protein
MKHVRIVLEKHDAWMPKQDLIKHIRAYDIDADVSYVLDALTKEHDVGIVSNQKPDGTYETLYRLYNIPKEELEAIIRSKEAFDEL